MSNYNPTTQTLKQHIRLWAQYQRNLESTRNNALLTDEQCKEIINFRGIIEHGAETARNHITREKYQNLLTKIESAFLTFDIKARHTPQKKGFDIKSESSTTKETTPPLKDKPMPDQITTNNKAADSIKPTPKPTPSLETPKITMPAIQNDPQKPLTFLKPMAFNLQEQQKRIQQSFFRALTNTLYVGSQYHGNPDMLMNNKNNCFSNLLTSWQYYEKEINQSIYNPNLHPGEKTLLIHQAHNYLKLTNSILTQSYNEGQMDAFFNADTIEFQIKIFDQENALFPKSEKSKKAIIRFYKKLASSINKGKMAPLYGALNKLEEQTGSKKTFLYTQHHNDDYSLKGYQDKLMHGLASIELLSDDLIKELASSNDIQKISDTLSTQLGKIDHLQLSADNQHFWQQLVQSLDYANQSETRKNDIHIIIDEDFTYLLRGKKHPHTTHQKNFYQFKISQLYAKRTGEMNMRNTQKISYIRQQLGLTNAKAISLITDLFPHTTTDKNNKKIVIGLVDTRKETFIPSKEPLSSCDKKPTSKKKRPIIKSKPPSMSTAQSQQALQEWMGAEQEKLDLLLEQLDKYTKQDIDQQDSFEFKLPASAQIATSPYRYDSRMPGHQYYQTKSRNLKQTSKVKIIALTPNPFSWHGLKHAANGALDDMAILTNNTSHFITTRGKSITYSLADAIGKSNISPGNYSSLADMGAVAIAEFGVIQPLTSNGQTRRYATDATSSFISAIVAHGENLYHHNQLGNTARYYSHKLRHTAMTTRSLVNHYGTRGVVAYTMAKSTIPTLVTNGKIYISTQGAAMSNAIKPLLQSKTSIYTARAGIAVILFCAADAGAQYLHPQTAGDTKSIDYLRIFKPHAMYNAYLKKPIKAFIEESPDIVQSTKKIGNVKLYMEKSRLENQARLNKINALLQANDKQTVIGINVVGK